eukprot:symbB.v1.2.026002.t1/scaffold2564.1/size76319/1
MFRFNSEVEVYLDLADSDADDPDEEDWIPPLESLEAALFQIT